VARVAVDKCCAAFVRPAGAAAVRVLPAAGRGCCGLWVRHGLCVLRVCGRRGAAALRVWWAAGALLQASNSRTCSSAPSLQGSKLDDMTNGELLGLC
jgi:hypothetical protein